MFDKQCEIRRKHFLSDFPFFHFRDTPNVGRACGFARPLLRPRLSRGWSQWPGGTLHSPVNGGSPGRRGPSPSSSPCLSLLGWGEDQLLIPEPPSPQAHRIPLCWGGGPRHSAQHFAKMFRALCQSGHYVPIRMVSQILEERLWQKPCHLPCCQAQGSLPERQAHFSCHHFLHKANFVIISESQENGSKHSKPHMPRSNCKFTSLFPSQMHRITR